MGGLVAVTDGLSLGEAVPAVNRAVAARFKRHFRVLAALGADRREELARTTVAAAFAALGLTGLTAGGATLRVGVALLREELLVLRGVGELLPAVSAC